MKAIIASLFGIMSIIFISCSDQTKRGHSANVSSAADPGVVQILGITVYAIAVLPDGTEVVVKKFDTPPVDEIKGMAHIKLSDTSDIELDLPIRTIADITVGHKNGYRTVKSLYYGQRVGDLIDPMCGNPVQLVKK